MNQRDQNDTMNDYMKRLRNLTGEEGTQVNDSGSLVPELILTFQIFYMTTPFTRQPVGLVTVSDIALLNLTNHIPASTFLHLDNNQTLAANKASGPKLSEQQKQGVYLEFKLNKIKNSTEIGKHVRSSIDQVEDDSYLKREQLCLFSQDYDSIEVMRSGKSYYVRG